MVYCFYVILKFQKFQIINSGEVENKYIILIVLFKQTYVINDQVRDCLPSPHNEMPFHRNFHKL